MSHFARVDQGIVQEVIVADQDFIDNLVYDKPGDWIQCSYNTRGGVHYQPNSNTPSDDQSKMLRYNYPGPGDIYDKYADAFHAPQSYASWTLDKTTTFTWSPPIDVPSNADTHVYEWDEDAYQAALTDSSDTSVAWKLIFSPS